MKVSVFLCLTCVLNILDCVESAGVQCLSNFGKPVDWFIVYKLPDHVALPDNTFYYMDEYQLSWQRQQKTIDQEGHAVYFTLNQIYSPSGYKNYSSSELLYAMYNDQEKNTSHNRWRSSSYGHTKGVIAFDRSSGFWLVHSTPNFPPPKTEGYHWPHSGRDNGQTFLCVSMDTGKNLDTIGKQLLYNYPDIYDKGSSVYFEQKFPKMASAMNKSHVTESPWNSAAQLTSLAGTNFYSFAKFSNYGEDLYKDWLAPRFKDALYVETWQSGSGGRLCTNCTGNYWVYNIQSIAFKAAGVVFKETKDHAKWAISKNLHWTCIGDINRMESQERRAGGTVCFQNEAVWKNFHGLINSTQACGAC